MIRFATWFLASVAFAATAFAAPGDLAPSFVSNGVRELSMGKSMDRVAALLPQGDGKVVAVGTSNLGVAFARYDGGGALDPSFGSGGLRRHRVPGGVIVQTAVRRPDGRIVVLGVCYLPPIRYCLSQYQADGSLDSSFGTATVPTPSWGYPRPKLAIAADGAVLINVLVDTSIAVYRFRADGVLDTDFANGGRLDAGLGVEYPGALLVQPDGRIIVVGTAQTFAKIRARRFMPDGSPDPSFSLVTESPGRVTSAVLEPDGKVVVAGCTASAGQYLSERPMLLRWQSGGALDAAFGDAGVARPLANRALCVADMALRADGWIAVSLVDSQIPQPPMFHVMQLDGNGQQDPLFGDAGHLEFFVGTAGVGNAVAIAGQPDGKLLVAGEAREDFALARVSGSGQLDPSFGIDGRVITEFNAGGGGTPIAMRKHGAKTVVLARLPNTILYPPAREEVGLARLLPDGSMDPTFGSGGHVTSTLGKQERFPGNTPRPAALAVQPDGKAIVAGIGMGPSDSSSDSWYGVVMRFTEDGAVDAGFGTSGRRLLLAQGDVKAIEVLQDGRIVAAGLAPGFYFVARLLPDGTPDASFGLAGAGGIAQFPYQGGDGFTRMSIRELSDGGLLVSGIGSGLGAVRLLADGSPDLTYANAGAFSFPPPPLEGCARQLSSRGGVVHDDGRLAVVGNLIELGGNGCSTPQSTWVAFARVDATGAATSVVPASGLLWGLRGASIEVAALDAQDRVVVGGRSQSPFVARFTPNGALDTSFGSNGFAAAGTAGAIRDVIVLSDGRILALGESAMVDSTANLYMLQGGGDSAPVGTPQDADGDGAPSAAEVATGRDPFVRDNDVFTVARLFAMQQYRDFLGREGDIGGVDYWAAQLAGAQTRTQMVEAFLGSPEFQGLAAPVARLYFAYFLRIPDLDGLNYWIGRYRGGDALEAISNLFAGSPEFAGMYGALDNAGFVDRVYRNVLGRAPDGDGLAFWKSRLDSGLTRGQMMVAFSESAEYRSLIANEVYVTMLYVGMLRRAPDAGGFSYWVSYLDGGNSGLALIDGFLAAPEYRGRFLQ